MLKRLARILAFVLTLAGGYAAGLLIPVAPAEDNEGRTWLELRAYPRVSNARSDQPIYVFAEIKGDETEDFYCPARELRVDGERVSAGVSDCPPFGERTEYPRRWIYYLPRIPGEHVAELTLSHGGRVVARARATWLVQ